MFFIKLNNLNLIDPDKVRNICNELILDSTFFNVYKKKIINKLKKGMKFIYNFIFNYVENKIKNWKLIIFKYFTFIFLSPFINTCISNFTIIEFNKDDIPYYLIFSITYYCVVKSYIIVYKIYKTHQLQNGEMDSDLKEELMKELNKEFYDSVLLTVILSVITKLFSNK